jgi:hypothetical protein
MAKLLMVFLVLFLISAGISLGCTSGVPSNEDIGKVILSYLQRDSLALSDSPYRDVQSVNVIEVGEPDEQGMTMWTVKVEIVRPNRDEQAEYIIFRDTFGKLRVLRRIATSCFEMFPIV